MFSVTKLSAGYGGAPVVRDISFSLRRGGSLILVGQNGCGKTTLLRALIGMLNYDGTVALDGADLRKMGRKRAARKVAMLSQLAPLYQSFSVYETVLMGRYPHRAGLFGGLTRADRDMAARQLENVGLYELRNRLANTLSGGQLQRLFLARAFCQSPEVLLLDEPTNHLDLKQQFDLIALLAAWRAEGGIVCGAMHDLNLVLRFGGDVMLMDDGRAVLHGRAADVLQSDAINTCFGMDVARTMRETLAGWTDGSPPPCVTEC